MTALVGSTCPRGVTKACPPGVDDIDVVVMMESVCVLGVLQQSYRVLKMDKRVKVDYRTPLSEVVREVHPTRENGVTIDPPDGPQTCTFDPCQPSILPNPPHP